MQRVAKILIHFVINVKSIGEEKKKKCYNPILRGSKGKNVIAMVEVGCLTRWKSEEGNVVMPSHGNVFINST